MKENKEWKNSLEDALLEIHRQLLEDEQYLSRRLEGGAFGDELAEEELRLRRIFSLAVMMEETIDAFLKDREAEDPAAGMDELSRLEYTSHIIGTPDDEGQPPSIWAARRKQRNSRKRPQRKKKWRKRRRLPKKRRKKRRKAKKSPSAENRKTPSMRKYRKTKK